MHYELNSGRKIVLRLMVLLGLLLLPNNLLAYSFSGWYHGASGHGDAIEEAINEQKPCVVYFHAEWCKWCKKMNSEYLASYELRQLLSDIPRVEINPDKGPTEKALLKKYGVKGVPSFFVFIPGLNSTPGRKIHPFGKSKNWTSDNFLQAIRTKLVNEYNKKGYSYYKSKKYEEAINYYEMSIDYDPENVYAYYGMGLAYHSIAYEEKDTELLEEAEYNYSKALEADPNHEPSKRALQRLHRAMEKMGIR